MIALINRKRLINTLTYKPRQIHKCYQFEWEIVQKSKSYHKVYVRNTNNNFTWTENFNGFMDEDHVNDAMKSMMSIFSANPLHLEEYE